MNVVLTPDSDEGWVLVRFEYDPNAVLAMKTIPTSARFYDPQLKVWGVTKDMVAYVTELFEDLGFTVIDKVEDPRSLQGDPYADPLDGLMAFLNAIPTFEWQKKVLRIAIASMHPDLGGDVVMCQRLVAIMGEEFEQSESARG